MIRGLFALCFIVGCGARVPPPDAPRPGTHRPQEGDHVPSAPVKTFRDDLSLLEHFTKPVVLSSEDGRARIVVSPEYQGRVMTSTTSGELGRSLGYIHRPGVEAAKRTPHMTVLGGEDRFWLGPEGGQFALYFKPGDPFDLEHWQVPEPFDWGAWPITGQSASEVSFRRDMELTNWSNTHFSLRVDRTVRLLDRAKIEALVSKSLDANISVVGYESDNVVTNTGKAAWTKASGLISVWILGMFNPSPRTTIVLPFEGGDEKARGPLVNDRYFGKIPDDRLRIQGDVLLFRGDGQQRGKIGVSKARAKNVAGSYDAKDHLLTLVYLTLPKNAAEYVNSMWEKQDTPYAGDVVNSYNDGPLGPALPPLGPFYEIESSSPALALLPNESARHVHTTLHFEGDPEALDAIARAQLGISLAEIAAAFP